MLTLHTIFMEYYAFVEKRKQTFTIKIGDKIFKKLEISEYTVRELEDGSMEFDIEFVKRV